VRGRKNLIAAAAALDAGDFTSQTKGRNRGSALFLTRSKPVLGELQVFSRGLATVFHEVERDLLAFGETGKTRALNGTNVDENVLSAIGGLDEAVTFFSVKPFDGALLHRRLLSLEQDFERNTILCPVPQREFSACLEDTDAIRRASAKWAKNRLLAFT